MQNPKTKILIGIDPGVTTGVAIYNRETRQFTEVASMKIHYAMNRVMAKAHEFQWDLLVRVEDARLRTWIPRMPTFSREKGRREGAGSVKRDAKIWEDFLRDHSILFDLVPPKMNRTKLTRQAFETLAKWEKATNQHGRDAAMLVYGH